MSPVHFNIVSIPWKIGWDFFDIEYLVLTFFQQIFFCYIADYSFFCLYIDPFVWFLLSFVCLFFCRALYLSLSFLIGSHYILKYRWNIKIFCTILLYIWSCIRICSVKILHSRHIKLFYAVFRASRAGLQKSTFYSFYSIQIVILHFQDGLPNFGSILII